MVSVKDSPRIAEPTEVIEKIEAANVAVPQNPSFAESGKAQKTAPGKLDSEPTKEVLAPRVPMVPEVPVPNEEEVKNAQEAEISRIVMERYPDIPKISFSDKYPSLEKLPRNSFPGRIQTHQELNFKLEQGGKAVGRSYVKAEGFVRPRRIEGDMLDVSSLANEQMVETLALSQTDFVTVIEANYNAGLERAIERLGKMRAADKSDILKNPELYQKLIAEEKVWHDMEAEQFDYVKLMSKQKLAGSLFKPVAFYANGNIRIDEGGPYSGVHYVVIVLLEGSDAGFGPYYWRARCLLLNGQIVGWLGIPEKSATNS